MNVPKALALALLPLAGGCQSLPDPDERARNPYDTDVLIETFGYGPETPALVEYENLYQGCPRRDCIPSIDDPMYVSAAEADFLDDDELVLAVNIDAQRRAYPVRVMDHHEIVNGTIGGRPIAVTWCPLCGSGVAFEAIVDGEAVEFGVSAILHDSDLVMYDRKTHSLWQQITGQAIMGPRMGDRLDFLPLTMTDWKTWREANPDTLVLSLDTDMNYGRQRNRRYAKYEEIEEVLFPVTGRDLSIHPKTVVFGFEIGDRKLAVMDGTLRAHQGEIQTRLADQALTVRRHPDGSVTATDAEGNTFTAMRLFWFAWFNFHPDTERI